MRLNLKNTNTKKFFLVSITLVLLFFVFCPTIVRAQGLEDVCDPVEVTFFGTSQVNMVVNRSMACPTEISASEYVQDLLDVPGIRIESTSKPNNIPDLKDRISEEKDLIQEIIKIQTTLAQEKASAEIIASGWNWGVNTGQPGGVGFSRKRVAILKAMLLNANEKISLLQWDITSSEGKIYKIKLDEVMQSQPREEEAIKRLQTQWDQTLIESKARRIKIQQELANKKALNDAACWPGGSLTPNIGNCILIGTGWVGNIITLVFSLLLWVASELFDMSVWMSIDLIGDWFETEAVETIWRLVRDLANLGFVFVLLYIALGTVLELSGMGDTKKLIISVIIAALLVNFSGFFVRVIVDASNIIAYEFYNQTKGESGSISTELVRKLDLSRYFIDSQSLEDATSQVNQKFVPPMVNRLSFIGIIAQTFGNIIIILVTSFVLLTVAILFIIRTIYLLLLYMLSPIAFVSRMIPSSKFNYFDKWRDALIKQSFFAPAFLIPLYLVFKLLGEGGISSLGGISGGWGGLAVGGSLTLIMIDAIIIGLLFGCIAIATKMGAAGAKMATGVAGAGTLLGVKGMTKGMTTGLKYGASGARYGGGKIGNKIGSMTGTTGRRMSSWARLVQDGSTTPGLIKRAGARAVTGTQRAGNITRDTARKVGGSKIGEAIRGDAKTIGKTIGKSELGQKVGRIAKNPLLATNDAISTVAATAGLGSISFLGKTSAERTESKKKGEEKKKEDKKEEIKQKGEQLKATTSEAAATAILLTMTNSEIKQLKADALTHSFVARSLNWSNLEALEKEGKLSDGQKATIKTAITTGSPLPDNNAAPNSGYAYMDTGPGQTIW